MRKLHYLFVITFYFFTAIPSVFGQQCHDYACVIAKVEKLLKQPQKDYGLILDNLDSAEGYPNSNAEQIRKLRRRVFGAIEGEKKKAKEAEEKAVKLAENLQIEKDRANLAFLQADSARKKVQAVLDKIYFYDDKFGLAYDKMQYLYGFIDKKLNTKIDFKYTYALPFNETGFAKAGFVTIDDLLIDTFGNVYPLATNIKTLLYTTALISAVDLSHNYLKEIPDDIFEKRGIKILILNYNDITIIPSAIERLKNLTFLILRGNNQLISFPSEIGKLDKLMHLDLSFSYSLKKIPSEIFHLKNLSYLNLAETGLNDLPDIPQEIVDSSTLQYCNLGFNDFNNLPIVVCRFKKLASLILNNNSLKTLPAEIKQLSNLASLDLSDNILYNIPLEIGRLSNLTNLYVNGNRLIDLPEDFEKLSKLTHLNLSDNKFNNLPLSVIRLTNLRELNLSNNQLTNLPESISNLRNLVYLNLSNSKFTRNNLMNNFSKQEQEKIKKLLPNCKIEF